MGATYLRYGRGESLRSLSAKADGTFPKTLFKKEYSITPKQWKMIDEIHTPSEWHHTGKYANKTYFYNPADVKLAWIENYGYDTLPNGLKGIETYEIRRFNENQRKMKYGFNIWSNTQKSNKHFSIQVGFTKLLYKGEFDKAGRLLNKLGKGTYVTMNIDTGLISMQTKTNHGNMNSKNVFAPHTNLGYNYFSK